MFGERYFATRERLSATVEGIRRLARETGTEAPQLKTGGEFLTELASPILFVVCGEVNAGKSTFINGLFGKDLCKTNVLPETDHVQWFRYGEDERDEEVTEVLEERYRNIEFLQDFNVVDTPGTNSVKKGHQAITERFLPVADLVLFIFPVTNPWGAATWDFLASFPDELEGKVALVLQQKDQREEQDVVVMIEHMKDLAVKKIGYAPEVFPVSGLQAFEAKIRQPFQSKLWRESGYPALEEFVSRKVSQSPVRKQVLREIRDVASATLRRIEERLDQRTRTLDSDQGFLREIEVEVEHERERHAQRFGEKFSGLGDVFGEQASLAGQLLRERTSMWSSLVALFKKDGTPAEIEKGLIEAVQAAVEEQAAADGEELVDTCRAHWGTVVPRVEERLAMPAPDFEEESGGFAGSKERFAKRLGRAARQAVVGQKLRGMLDMQMEVRRGMLRRFVVACLILLAIGGALGGAGQHLPGALSAGGGLVVLVIGLVQSEKSSRELVEWFEERASSSRRPFAEALSEDYKEGVRGFFVEYANLFEGIRRHIAELKLQVKPQLDRWNDLFIELRAIDQEL